MSTKLTTEDFIEKARKVHRDKYDYSKVEYVNAYTKVCIICPEHGEFYQRASNHLIGKGCPKCGRIEASNKHKIGTEQFIEMARKVHGDKYDYSKVDYADCETEVVIICPKHGEFKQTPISHLRGKGCSKCAVIKRANERKYTKEEFIEKARKVHGDKYDYSKVEYTHSKRKVCIICPEHGEFYQTPNSHLRGCGCFKCVCASISQKQLSNNKEFIEKARKVHGDKYDYSKVEYVNAHTKVCIICPEHGEFYQKPNKHLSGTGCPTCKESHMERDIRQLLIEKGIDFVAQKRFKWLGLQSLDFYLPKCKIGIECQGIQHFKTNNFFKEGITAIKERDKRKRELCVEHGIKLLYYTDVKLDNYPYDVLQSIDSITEKILSL